MSVIDWGRVFSPAAAPADATAAVPVPVPVAAGTDIGDGPLSLVEAAKQLAIKTAQAKQSGVSIPQPMVEEWARFVTGGKYGAEQVSSAAQALLHASDVSLGSVARSMGQGATFGWGDNIYGKFAGDDKADLYRAKEELFHRAHPVLDFTGKAVGSLAAPVALAAAAGAAPEVALGAGAATALDEAAGASIMPEVAPTVTRTVSRLLARSGAKQTLKQLLARGSLAGATAGALQGAGDADNPGESRLTGAVGGGAVGGLLGLLPPAVIGAGRNLLGGAGGAAADRLMSAIAGSESEGKFGLAAIQNEMNKFARAGRAGVATLADLSPRLRELTDFAANTAGKSRTAVEEMLAPRNEDASQRLIADVTAARGDALPANAPRQLRVLAGARRAVARDPDTGYGALRTANASMDNSGVLQAMKDANPMIADQLPNELPGFREAQTLAETLADRAKAAFRAGRGNEGEANANALKMLKDHLHLKVPGYAELDAQYARMSQGIDALKTAYKYARGREVAALDDAMDNLRDGHALTQAQYGVAASIIRRLTNAQSPIAALKNIVGKSIADKTMLEHAVPDAAARADLLDRASAERTLTWLNDAVRNSKTALRLSEQEAQSGIGEAVGHGLFGALKGGAEAVRSLPHVIEGVTRAGRRLAAHRTAEGLTDTNGANLLAQGPDEIRRVLEYLARRSNGVGVNLLGLSRYPAIAGGAAGVRALQAPDSTTY